MAGSSPQSGTCQITIQSLPASLVPKFAAHGDRIPAADQAPSAIPTRYRRAENGLTVEILRGQKSHDIALVP